MKLTANRAGLLSACQLAAMAAPTRDVKPILRNLLLRAEGESCEVVATDLEIGLRINVSGVRVDMPGDALMPAGRFVQILRELPDEDVLLDADMAKANVSGASSEFDMPSDDPSDFPMPSDDGAGDKLVVSSAVLRGLLTRTLFAAASTEHSRFGATTGVLFSCNDNGLKLVATDGRRLALATGEFVDADDLKGMPIIPARAATMLMRLIGNDDEEIKAMFKPNDITFTAAGWTLYTRVVEGRFPDYRKVIPSKSNMKFELPAGAFLSALRQAAIMTDDESKRVIFNFADGKLTLKASGSSSGKSLVLLTVTGDGKLEISFDPKFLVDFLKVLPSDGAVSAEFLDGKSAGVFRFGVDYLYVVVPLVGGNG